MIGLHLPKINLVATLIFSQVESMIRNFALRQALQARMEQILEENRTQRPNQNNDEHSNNKKNESSQIGKM